MTDYNPEQFHIRSPDDRFYSEARRVHAVLLRREGCTYQVIGKHLGITRARAREVVLGGERTKVIP